MAIYRCRVRGHNAQISQWTFSFSVSAVTGLAQDIADTVADGVTAMWDGVPAGTNALKTLYDTATLVDDALVDELDAPMEHNVAQGRTVINRAGTGTGEPLPANVAVVMSQVTNLPTRAGRGRSYAPPPTVDSVNNGDLATASRDIFAHAYKNLFDTIQAAAGGAYSVVIRHPSFIPAPSTPVLGVRVGSVFDTQRRRRNKVKELYDELTLA